MYERKLPRENNLVMTKVLRIDALAATVYFALLEYDGIEAMAQQSEMSRRRVRSIHALTSIGKQEVYRVLRVDEAKGYVDLSKKMLTEEDIQGCEERYQQSRTVHGILAHVAHECKIRLLEDIYLQFGWNLYKRFGHAYRAFELLVKEEEQMDEETKEEKKMGVLSPYTIPPIVLKSLKQIVAHRFARKLIKLRAEIEVKCFGPDGIDAIKTALHTGQQQSTPDIPIDIRIMAAPLYTLTTRGMMRSKDAIKQLQKAIDTIGTIIATFKDGKCVVLKEPHVISQQDEQEIRAKMDALEKENQEVDGDADGDVDV